MMSLSLRYHLAALFLILTALPLAAFGQSELLLNPPIQAKTIDQIVSILITFAEAVITPLSALAVMIAAFLYITAGGSEERVTKGHRALTYGVVGIAIVLSARFLKDVVIGVAGGATRAENFAIFLQGVVQAFGTVLMGISVLAVLFAAFLFITGGGNPDKVTAARRTLTFALVGVAVALLAFAVPALVSNVIGKP